MRRSTTNHLLSLGLLTLGTLGLIPGCADNNSSLFVVGVIDIDAATCLAKPDTTATLLANGTMDLAFTSSYTANLLVGNQLTQRGSREQVRTETSRITLRGAEVTLTTLDGQTLGKGSFSTVGTGFVDAASGDVPAYGVMSVNLIPPALGSSVAVENARVVLAKVRVFGDTLGGSAITSSELDFPINVCRGCLVRYPASAADPAQGAGAPYLCSKATTATTATDSAPCVTGQDQPFSCTLCSSASDVCRDPKNNCSYTPTPANCMP
jgi:hypothetical protein